MRVIARRKLREFWARYPDAEDALEAWFYEAEHAQWRSSADVKAKYGAASIVTNERVVFNIRGNKYRLVVVIKYEFKLIYIRFIGTHKEYNDIDAETV